MNPLARLFAWLRPTPKTPEEVEAAHEAERIRSELETIRVSQRSMAGQNYQSGRGSRH
jgi:hypothetical protein